MMAVSIDFLRENYPDVFDLWAAGTEKWFESLTASDNGNIVEAKKLYIEYESLRDEYNFALKILGYVD